MFEVGVDQAGAVQPVLALRLIVVALFDLGGAQVVELAGDAYGVVQHDRQRHDISVETQNGIHPADDVVHIRIVFRGRDLAPGVVHGHVAWYGAHQFRRGKRQQHRLEYVGLLGAVERGDDSGQRIAPPIRVRLHVP
ncbi:hypothetical protein D3C72_1093890 [compost metagenome]